jgi:DnaD/phage-associated family protein
VALPQHEYRQEYVAIPSGLFGPLLEGVDDLLELRCALRALFLLHRKKGPLRSVTAAELAGDPVLLGGAQTAGEPLAEADVARALQECVAHGVLIAYTSEDGGLRTDLYLLDTPANRRALDRVRSGQAPPPDVPSPAPEASPAAPRGIFALYEANIGAIYPMAAEQLRAMEEDFPATWIEEAFLEAVRHNRRRLAYIEAILRRWRDDGRGDGATGRHPGKVPASHIFRYTRR